MVVDFALSEVYLVNSMGTGKHRARLYASYIDKFLHDYHENFSQNNSKTAASTGMFSKKYELKPVKVLNNVP